VICTGAIALPGGFGIGSMVGVSRYRFAASLDDWPDPAAGAVGRVAAATRQAVRADDPMHDGLNLGLS